MACLSSSELPVTRMTAGLELIARDLTTASLIGAGFVARPGRHFWLGATHSPIEANPNPEFTH